MVESGGDNLMGRSSRLKQRRRTAAFSVRCQGALEVLSIGKGDLKIAIGDSNKDRADAQHLIEEMLRKGYTLFVETADGLLKVTRFLPDQMAYVVADTPDVVADQVSSMGDPAPDLPPAAHPDSPGARDLYAADRKPAARRKAKRTVPVAGSKTTAIGRTAGG